MATDTSRGIIRFFEDFLYDVVADKPEYSVDTDPAVEIVATAIGGVVRTTMDAGQTNIGGMSFGQLQWSAYDNYLYGEWRVKFSAVPTTAERVFVGFTDVQEDTLTEMPFTGATTVTTVATNPTDVIGFFWEGDMTGNYFAPASQKTDSLVVHGSANMSADEKRLATFVIDQWYTLGVRIESGAKHVTFTVDGKTVYLYKNADTAAIADVPLTPYFVVQEGTTAINFDVDYVYVEAGRDN